eukprot:CAMPEP_0197857552 /NCGR_PEP_ID=MMETSP1438-20131217/30722_1 /TAXON_ID=1461541 /ORGANISM="Pterosperma sp., Strain CCMP1384" /LENGTH=161 /DNA_ID=CAMNT_0043473419 /DNA_START=137 /DNA_END=619 /DNA_ORIENTATION=+
MEDKMQALTVDDVIQGLSGITGSSVSKVTPHDFPGTGRGMKCLTDVKKDDLLLAIPFDSCWTETTARACPELVPVVEKCDLSADQLMQLHLLVEKSKGKKSGMHTHIATLPETFDNCDYWTEEERKELKGSRWLHFLKAEEGQIREDYAALEAALKKEGLS